MYLLWFSVVCIIRPISTSIRYEAAAEDFSKSHLSFEEVALKFLQVRYITVYATSIKVQYLHVWYWLYMQPLALFCASCIGFTHFDTFLCVCVHDYMYVIVNCHRQVNRKEALKKFLHLKLDSLNTETDKTQCTMLTIWLIEMYLNELGVYKDSNNTDQYLKLQEEFHDSFLQKKSIKVELLYSNNMKLSGQT